MVIASDVNVGSGVDADVSVGVDAAVGDVSVPVGASVANGAGDVVALRSGADVTVGTVVAMLIIVAAAIGVVVVVGGVAPVGPGPGVSSMQASRAASISKAVHRGNFDSQGLESGVLVVHQC